MSQSGVYGSGGGGGMPITTLAGDTGTATGSTINVITGFTSGPYANGTIQFNASGSTIELNTTDGLQNTGIGPSVFQSVPGSGAFQNVGFGQAAGASIGNGGGAATGNCLFGFAAGSSITTGSNNNSFGLVALNGVVDGQWNIAIGAFAGNALTGSESSNIYFNTQGVLGESNTLRIGKATGAASQDIAAAFICGIQGVDVGSVASVVAINGDQLGSTTITAGTGITVTPGANTITIAAAASGLSWVDVPGNSQTMVPNTGYVADDNVLVTFTLPVTAAFGTIMWVVGNGSGGWTINQNAGQSIIFGSAGATTVGVGGSLSSTNQYDTIQILCVVADTTWNVLTSAGNITIV